MIFDAEGVLDDGSLEHGAPVVLRLFQVQDGDWPDGERRQDIRLLGQQLRAGGQQQQRENQL